MPAGTLTGVGVLASYLFALHPLKLPLIEARTAAITVLIVARPLPDPRPGGHRAAPPHDRLARRCRAGRAVRPRARHSAGPRLLRARSPGSGHPRDGSRRERALAGRALPQRLHARGGRLAGTTGATRTTRERGLLARAFESQKKLRPRHRTTLAATSGDRPPRPQGSGLRQRPWVLSQIHGSGSSAIARKERLKLVVGVEILDELAHPAAIAPAGACDERLAHKPSVVVGEDLVGGHARSCRNHRTADSGPSRPRCASPSERGVPRILRVGTRGSGRLLFLVVGSHYRGSGSPGGVALRSSARAVKCRVAVATQSDRGAERWRPPRGRAGTASGARRDARAGRLAERARRPSSAESPDARLPQSSRGHRFASRGGQRVCSSTLRSGLSRRTSPRPAGRRAAGAARRPVPRTAVAGGGGERKGQGRGSRARPCARPSGDATTTRADDVLASRARLRREHDGPPSGQQRCRAPPAVATAHQRWPHPFIARFDCSVETPSVRSDGLRMQPQPSRTTMWGGAP